ncbi:MAG: J domain-containing protein [Stanieria sp.]
MNLSKNGVSQNHYQILEVSDKATQQEIKQAYRRLAKVFHPDSQHQSADHNKIIALNAAYEILSNPQSRRLYDLELDSGQTLNSVINRQERTTHANQQYQRYRQAGKKEELQYNQWLTEVYRPINRLISLIINPLETEIDYLAADPFDQELMDNFCEYLENCRHYWQNASNIFSSQPNPAKLAGVAANLYYCITQIGDGIRELEWFTLNYDDHYLHTGQEIFRIAQGLRWQAQEAIKSLI